jgi:hypothetical protein
MAAREHHEAGSAVGHRLHQREQQQLRPSVSWRCLLCAAAQWGKGRPSVPPGATASALHTARPTRMQVMEALKELTEAGHTVVASIHQPRSRIFELFDDLLLLSEGCALYSGPAAAALDHFAQLGHECPVHHNPAEFLADLIPRDASSPDAVQDSRARFERLLASAPGAMPPAAGTMPLCCLPGIPRHVVRHAMSQHHATLAGPRHTARKKVPQAPRWARPGRLCACGDSSAATLMPTGWCSREQLCCHLPSPHVEPMRGDAAPFANCRVQISRAAAGVLRAVHAPRLCVQRARAVCVQSLRAWERWLVGRLARRRRRRCCLGHRWCGRCACCSSAPGGR